jgi:predicted nucleic acid-binding Zn ribbon protein
MKGRKPKYLVETHAVCVNCNKMFEVYDSFILCSKECEDEYKRKLK